MNGDGFGTSGVRSRCSDWDCSSAPTLVGPYRGCQWGEQSRLQGLYIGTRVAPQAPCFVGSIPRLHTGYKIGTAELAPSGYRSRCFAHHPPTTGLALGFLGFSSISMREAPQGRRRQHLGGSVPLELLPARQAERVSLRSRPVPSCAQFTSPWVSPGVSAKRGPQGRRRRGLSVL